MNIIKPLPSAEYNMKRIEYLTITDITEDVFCDEFKYYITYITYNPNPIEIE